MRRPTAQRATCPLPVPLGDQGPVQHDVHLAGPERRVVLSMNRADLGPQDLVALHAWSGRAGPGRVDGGWGDLDAGACQRGTDRPRPRTRPSWTPRSGRSAGRAAWLRREISRGALQNRVGPAKLADLPSPVPRSSRRHSWWCRAGCPGPPRPDGPTYAKPPGGPQPVSDPLDHSLRSRRVGQGLQRHPHRPLTKLNRVLP